MAVEIAGESDRHWFKTDCPECGAILKYKRVDIKIKTVTDYTGDRDEIRYINCPRCNREITKGWADYYEPL